MTIKGFAITPVVLGRIAIGEIVENNGKRLPSRLDHIVITGMVQANGDWVEHPEMTRLKAEEVNNNPPQPGKGVKLRSIPVRIMFDKPESNFRAEYNCFDDKGRPICTGDGEKARRRSANGVQDVACPGSDVCDFGQQHRCKQLGRLMIGLESTFENDPLSGFMFRTTSFNSIRALTARLNYLAAVTGGKIAGMPCNLRMRAKSTAASFRKPIFYLDLEPVGGLIAATGKAAEFRKKFEEAGLDRAQLEEAVANGLKESAFYEDQTDGEEIIEEFMMMDEEPQTDGKSGKPADGESKAGDFAVDNKGGEATNEQVTAIRTLLKKTNMDEAKLFTWLGKPAGELSTLTNAEAARAIQSLQGMVKKPAAAKPAKVEKPVASAQEPVVAKNGDAGGSQKKVETGVPPSGESNDHASSFF